jgi:hypothetical protein
MTWSHVLGVGVGSVFGLVFSLVLGMVMAIVILIYYMSMGAPLHQAVLQLNVAYLNGALFVLLSTLALGAFVMLLSGCLAAWLGRTYPVLIGLATGIATTVLSLPFCFFYTYPLWYNLAGVVVTIGPAAMGGYLARVLASLRRVPLPAAS